MRDNKKKMLLVDRLVDTHSVLLNDHFPGLVYEVSTLLAASLFNVERSLSAPFNIDNAEQILICTINVLVYSNDHYRYGLYGEKLIVLLVLDTYFREVNKSPYSQKLIPNEGLQTPRICNAVAWALKSSLLITECDDAISSETKRFSLFIRLKDFVPDMISLKSEEGQ